MVSASWLKQTELFKGLEEAQLSDLLERSTVESFPEGKIIFHQGAEATHLYILIQGAINLSVKAQEEIGFLTSQIREEGRVFGIPCLIEPFRYNVTARCIVPSKVLCIESHYLRQKMERDPKMGMQMMKPLLLLYYNRLNELRKGIVAFFNIFKVGHLENEED
jgi:CRP-like cAMP-binding protein